jgi:4-amino-4-deoxy-L-arabinose transferase-like glycosyltransferase
MIKMHENRSVVMLGLATGLAILTKETAYPFLIPFALANFIKFLWHPSRESLFSSIKAVAIVLLVVAPLNGVHFIRNYSLYQNPITTKQYASYHLNEEFSIVRHASLHTMTPWPAVKEWLSSVILKIHVKLNQSRSDPLTTLAGEEFRIPGYTKSEALSGNP